MSLPITQERLEKLNCAFGVDVSHIQADIDWSAFRHAGVNFAFVKLTEGHTGTGSYEGDVYPVKARCQEIVKHNIKLGYYHFARPGNVNTPEQDAALEVRNIVNHIKNENFPKPNFPIVLDLEAFSTNMQWPKENGANPPTKNQLSAFVTAFMTNLADNGYETIIYANPSFLNDHLPAGHQFAKLPLWIANYVNNPNTALPVIPRGWSQWRIWQYAEDGSVGGIHPIDVNMMSRVFYDKY